MTQNIYRRKDIIRKVKGMLDRANGTNFEAESVTALNMARELLAKYNLGMSDVVIDKGESVTLDPAFGTYGGWQFNLARVIADYCNCDLVIQTVRKREHSRTSQRIAFVGMSAELELCVYTHMTIFNQIKKMRIQINHKRRANLKKEGMILTRRAASLYSNGYVCGIVDYLKEELKKRIVDEKCRDLVLVKDPKINEWMINHCNGRKIVVRSVYGSRMGYDAGYKDGSKIELREGIKDRSSNGKQISKVN